MPPGGFGEHTVDKRCSKESLGNTSCLPIIHLPIHTAPFHRETGQCPGCQEALLTQLLPPPPAHPRGPAPGCAEAEQGAVSGDEGQD